MKYVCVNTFLYLFKHLSCAIKVLSVLPKWVLFLIMLKFSTLTFRINSSHILGKLQFPAYLGNENFYINFIFFLFIFFSYFSKFFYFYRKSYIFFCIRDLRALDKKKSISLSSKLKSAKTSISTIPKKIIPKQKYIYIFIRLRFVIKENIEYFF